MYNIGLKDKKRGDIPPMRGSFVCMCVVCVYRDKRLDVPKFKIYVRVCVESKLAILIYFHDDKMSNGHCPRPRPHTHVNTYNQERREEK